jgi:cytochrome c
MRKILSFAVLGILGALSFAAAEPKEKVVALVDKAAALIQSQGDKAFAEFRKKDSEWLKGDIYVFVDDMDGINLCHPVTPDLEGQNLLGMKDADGKEFVREMIELLKTKDAGWVEYSWKKPGSAAAAKKLAYVKKTVCGGKPVLVGSGIYAE